MKEKEADADRQDEILLQRVAEHDRTAIGQLYARHHRRIYHFILRMVADRDVAEDLTNDVFLELWDKAAAFEGRSRVSTWLLGIARFKALSELRRRRPTADPEEALAETDDGADTPEVTAQKSDKGARLRQCIRTLSPEHRQIIELVYYHEKSIREIAQLLQIPENTVKTRTFHARKQLSTAMKDAGIDRGWP